MTMMIVNSHAEGFLPLDINSCVVRSPLAFVSGRSRRSQVNCDVLFVADLVSVVVVLH